MSKDKAAVKEKMQISWVMPSNFKSANGRISPSREASLGAGRGLWPLMIALALASCGKEGALELRMISPPGQDPFAGATVARLTLGTSPPTVRSYPIQSDGTVVGDLKPAPINVVATVTIELLNELGTVLARGKTPEIPLSPSLSGYVEVLVGKVGAFAKLPNALPFARSRPAVLQLSSYQVMVAGGQGAAGPGVSGLLAASSVYNDYGFLFEDLPSLATPRAGAVVLPGASGTYVLYGGLVPNSPTPGPTATVEIYDITANTFTGGQGGGGARVSPSATPFPDSPDHWLVAGGTGPGDAPLATAVVFDTTTSALSANPASMTTARSGHTATAVQTVAGPRLLILGGNSLGADAELFEPVARTFTALPVALGKRSGHTASLLLDGRVVIAGGRDENGARADVLLFDPQAACTDDATCRVAFAPALDSSSPALPISLLGARYGHAAFALADNRVLFAAGRGPASPGAPDLALATAEVYLYDAASRHFTRDSAPMLSSARADFAAVELSTAQLLFVGGVDASGAPLATAELYNPR